MEPELDGVVQVLDVDGDDIQVAIVNPDGSLAEMSGNGTRIAAAWLMARTGSAAVRVHVGPRVVTVRRVGDALYESDVGEVAVGERTVVEGVEFVPVDVGNPHAVVEGDPSELPRIGPLLERHPRFPRRTNVQVARRIGARAVEARVWERGVGETGSSGTSAVAVTAALHLPEATVRFPAGELHVRIEDGRAFLTGPAQRI
jgi:diaminopimelate epimerase